MLRFIHQQFLHIHRLFLLIQCFLVDGCWLIAGEVLEEAQHQKDDLKGEKVECLDDELLIEQMSPTGLQYGSSGGRTAASGLLVCIILLICLCTKTIVQDRRRLRIWN